jgi:hypothetical protein
VVAAAWALPTVAGTALGYPAVPRYLVVPAAISCVLAGIGLVAVARLASGLRGRVALAAAVAAVSAPFAVSRAIGLAHQAADARARTEQLSALWRAVDQAQRRAPAAPPTRVPTGDRRPMSVRPKVGPWRSAWWSLS